MKKLSTIKEFVEQLCEVMMFSIKEAVKFYKNRIGESKIYILLALLDIILIPLKLLLVIVSLIFYREKTINWLKNITEEVIIMNEEDEKAY